MSISVRVLGIKENKMYPDGTPRHRAIFDQSFAEHVLSSSRIDQMREVYWMFGKRNINYNLQDCNKIQVILIVDRGWCLYEIDIKAKTMLVMDPMLSNSPAGTMEAKHVEISKQILHSIFKCLEECYPAWQFQTSPWTFNYNYKMHENCTISESGFYVLHYIKEFDGDKLMIPPTPSLIAYMRMHMAYEVLHIKGNAAETHFDIYGRIEE
ncbi:hypothetical protein ACQJBY_066363 [Aegilops geniculata]